LFVFVGDSFRGLRCNLFIFVLLPGTGEGCPYGVKGGFCLKGVDDIGEDIENGCKGFNGVSLIGAFQIPSKIAFCFTGVSGVMVECGFE
jgi:hypothetical protein